MRNLFRSFERAGVEYLLISGQASVLYGAATFSEDVDLWVRPTPANLRRLIGALGACRASVYKLTPPLSVRHARVGHGFHFLVPAKPLPVYLDVMGRPPRVGPFPAARRRACRIDTAWGCLPVVSIEDLVEIKKTRRLADYDVISSLVQARLAETNAPSRSRLVWAARNSFRAEERVEILAGIGRRASAERCRRAIAREVAALQARDVAYWRPITAELRRLRRAGLLLEEGSAVSLLRAQPG